MRLTVTTLLFVLLVSARAAVAGPITLTFLSPTLNAAPGSTATFAATVAEIGGTLTYLNGDSFSFPLPANDTPFLVNFPVSLSPFGAFTGDIVSVSVPLGTAPGLYNGAFTILGGATSVSQGALATAPFSVNVNGGATVVPEPSTIVLCGIGAAGLLRRRRQRR